MKIKINNADFAKAVDEALKESKFGNDENFRFAVETIAREILIASEWTNASPPAITHTALGVIGRVVWNSIDDASNR